MTETAAATPARASTRGATRTQRRGVDAYRLVAFVLGPLCAVVGVLLASQHPLSPALAVLAACGAGAAAFLQPMAGLALVPALLPVIGLAPWSGWISFEESDILVLAVAAGVYLRAAAGLRTVPGSAGPQPGTITSGTRAIQVLGLCGFAALTFTAMLRGFSDAGGFVFGWFQGYHESMNSARLAKAFFEALLLLPAWLRVLRSEPLRGGTALGIGMATALLLAALATLWERHAFTGLLDFSSDYRTTALFWEMNVGGAALDGFLAITVPFAFWLWSRSRTPRHWLASTALLLLAAYACLTTFSRGVYLCIPVGLAVYACVALRQRVPRAAADDATAAAPPVGRVATWLPAALLVLAFLACGIWVFRSGGFRALIAVLGCMVLLLPLAHVVRALPLNLRMAGVVMGLLVGGAMLALGALVAKAAYVAWALLALLTGLATWRWMGATRRAGGPGVLALTGYVGLLGATVGIAWYWGGDEALRASAPVVVLLGVALLCMPLLPRAPWPAAPRWQLSVVLAMVLAGATAGVFGGGSYMQGRFSTGGKDFDDRLSHWRLAASMLMTPADFWFGRGLGRFPSSYFLLGDPGQHPGDYRIHEEAGNPFLTLTGGLQTNGWGEIFRVTQRIAEPGPSAVFSARVRARKDAELHIEVCPKHLLYDNGQCSVAQKRLKAEPGVWQDVRITLPAVAPSRGDWFAPRLIAFSMATSSTGGSLDIDDVSLTPAQGGANLLANSDFSRQMARWFFSSDRNHMPWHAKNLWMHLWVEQGALSAALFVLLTVAALAQTVFGNARHAPLAPPLAAAIAGFLVVGLFDSLLDVPRVSAVFYLLLALALTLRHRGAVPMQAPPRAA